ncbi:MAG TPA: hypothetical protein DDZ51_21040 [Planctomycetaceae bacterium]|nr:hypothetical protein [Planctomycetaceae bacterium]
MTHREAVPIYKFWRAAVYTLLLLASCSKTENKTLDSETISGNSATTIPAPSVRFQFDDVSTASGIDSSYQNGESTNNQSILESLGGGTGIIDFDRDGHLDILLPGGGTIVLEQPITGLPTTLWRNTGDWNFISCSQQAGVSHSDFYTHGVVAGDVNQDGFMDFILTGYGGLQLFINQGDGTFANQSHSSGLKDDRWSSSAAFADFNEDGLLDLYVAHYVDWSWQNHPRCQSSDRSTSDVCGPGDFAALPDSLFIGTEEGVFRDATSKSGLVPGGKGLGVVACHLDNTPGIDIYVANDTTNNHLYLNRGAGLFQESGLIAGVAVDGVGTPSGSMGLAIVDFNQDQLPDIWVTNYESEPFGLYQNIGKGAFLFATNRAGVNRLGELFVGFGTVAADLDLDGDDDLVVSNGHVIQHPRKSTVAQDPLLLEGTSYDFDGPANQFERATFPLESYFGNKHRGRGLVTADFDRDGDLDLVFTHINRPPAILCNNTQPRGRLLSLELIGTTSNRDAIGAQVTLQTESRIASKQIVGGGSYLSQNPYTVNFTVLPDENIKSIEIKWPSGTIQAIGNLQPSEDATAYWNRLIVEDMGDQ